MLIQSVLSAATAFACGLILTGCNAVHEQVDTPALMKSMKKSVSEDSRQVQSLNMPTPINIGDFPLLKEVCDNTFDHQDYKYDGSMMRIKINKGGYNLGDDLLYKHEYALCMDFYPVAEGQTQEALYVQYFGTNAGYGSIIDKIAEITGGVNGLLIDSGYHLPSKTITENGWSSVPRKTYKDETSKVQYLKMDPLEMKAVNKYDADKYKNLMGFEFLHVDVTRVNGQLVVTDVKIAEIHHSMEKQAKPIV